MIKKLFFHDLKAVFKIWWIFAAVFTAFAALACLCAGVLDLGNGKVWLDSSQALSAVRSSAITGLVMSYLVMWVFYYASIAVPLVHHYKVDFTDEAYLTFTLPAKKSQIFAAEFMCALTFMAACLVMRLVGVSLVIFLASGSDPVTFSDFSNSVLFVVGINPLEALFAESVDPVFSLVAYIFEEVCLHITLVFALTLGCCMEKKHKILASLASFLLLRIVISLVEPESTLLGTLSGLFNDGIARTQAGGSEELFSFILSVATSLCLTAVMYVLSLHIVEKKLDLE
ncbi:MAG: hypothetical protein IJV00_08325 [Clostridia bacterium]|nr:hypothetical protein [Clostridia bacterium]